MISYTFFLKCLKLYFYNKIHNPSNISFYVWCEVVLKLCFFYTDDQLSHHCLWSSSLCLCWLAVPLLSYLMFPRIPASLPQERSFLRISLVIITLIWMYHCNELSLLQSLVKKSWNLTGQVQHPVIFLELFMTLIIFM